MDIEGRVQIMVFIGLCVLLVTLGGYGYRMIFVIPREHEITIEEAEEILEIQDDLDEFIENFVLKRPDDSPELLRGEGRWVGKADTADAVPPVAGQNRLKRAMLGYRRKQILRGEGDPLLIQEEIERLEG